MAKIANKPVKKTQSKQWSEWAAAAQAGDQKAYAKLLKDIVPSIQNILAGRLANYDWVDDITQEVLISVHKSLKTYSPERSFRPWLMAIVSFRRTDYLRKHYSSRQNVTTDLEDAGFQKGHVTNPLHAGEYIDVEKAMDALPAKQRKVFEMIKIKGYTAQEVADEMDMSVSAVKVSAHRTMKKIKKMANG